METPEDLMEMYLNGEMIDPCEHDPYVMEQFREMMGEEE